MRPISRSLASVVLESARAFSAVVVTGPRRSGKTFLLRRLFPKADYILLEDPDLRARARSDPRGLLEALTLPVLIDEIQNVPELFPYIRTLIDQQPRRKGQWLFTGSQEAPLMQGVAESMAGRAAILQLLPLSLTETDRVTLLSGGYPEVIARPKTRAIWFDSYIQTYLERDVRNVLNVRDLGTFRRFLAILASRHGQILNKTDLAAPLGMSVPTITHWLEILEITAQIILVPPYFKNLGKRLIKSPKVYIGDPGLACHLLGIRTQGELNRSPFLGPIFEGFVAAEILKSQVNQGHRKELYYFRDQQGLEVDFLFPNRSGALWMVECKAAKTVLPGMARPLQTLRKTMSAKHPVHASIVHRPSATGPSTRVLLPGIDALDTTAFVDLLNHLQPS